MEADADPAYDAPMSITRRHFVIAGAAGAAAMRSAAAEGAQKAPPRFGLIGKMTAVAGQREALMAILLEAVDDMPGCLSYIVATDAGDANAIWITEVWDSQASHAASLALPAVKAAIGKGRPLIASFDTSVTTVPVGGHGLPPSSR